jgi:hypothetical protein
MKKPDQKPDRHTRDVLGTVALGAVTLALACMLVAGFVWVVPLAFRLLVHRRSYAIDMKSPAWQYAGLSTK